MASSGGAGGIVDYRFVKAHNRDNPEKIATKAPRHKAESSVYILFFEPLCLGGDPP